MPKYRVREGRTHGALNQHKAGDIVELTVEEYRGVEDKLEPVSKGGELGYDVSAHSVKAVMLHVDNGVVTAAAALAQESARDKPRVSLVRQLTARAELAPDDDGEGDEEE